MRPRTWFVVAVAVALILVLAGPALAEGESSPRITLLNPLPRVLGLGESYTVDILVESDEPFTWATGHSAPYYPAYVRHTSDHGSGGNSALLHVTYIGRKLTAGLPDGVNPITLYVGVRYHGELVVEDFDFEVAVR